jgi:general secretion pathway protein F
VPLFEYSGFDVAGRKVSGAVEAAGRRAVMAKLRADGIFPTHLQEEKAKAPGKTRSLQLQRRVPVGELSGATRQLATLLGAGLPLDEALATVGTQVEHPRLLRAMQSIRDEVVQGESLHAALGRHPAIFPALYANMVEVGESTGTLDQVLKRLADFLEDQARIAGRIRAAMAYPLLMAVVGIVVLLFLLTFVVPKVTRMLEDLDQALPLPTLLLIRTNDFLAAWWWLLLLFIGAVLFGLYRYVRTDQGALARDRLILRLPLVGKLNLLIATARFSRTLSTLLRSGVPLLGALDISRNLLTNRVLRQVVEDTTVCVREGEGLSAPLRRAAVFPPLLVQMAAVGERSGEMEEMLMRVAEAYEHQVDLSVTGMLSLLEPLMILFMGTVVGYIVLAILLPIFEASQGMG